jgi:phenylacetate-CoA ligase
MSAFNWLQENIVLEISDIISQKSIARSLRFLLESQYWPYEKLKGFQDERLNILIRHAYDNVPFYHELFRAHHLVPSDIKTAADLQKLPVISKQDMQKYPREYYMARNLSYGRFIRMNSSGSTGEPFTYYINPEAYSMNYACAVRGWYWMGYRLGDSYAKLSQNPRKGLLKKTQDKVLRSEYIFIRDLTEDVLKSVVILLNQKRPDYIRCYPDPLVFISLIIKEGLNFNYTPKAINTTGNILTIESRNRIEKAFRAPVFDSYSCEASAQFFQDPDRKAYLASNEYAITEVIDNSDNPAHSGRHITTDLWNLAMPFIRYDTQDILEKTDTQYNLLMKLDSFSQIKGRNTDILVTPSGKYLIVHTFTIFFEYFEEILQFQVIQSRPDSVRVLLVVTGRYNKFTESSIYEGLKDLIGDDVNIEIVIASEIPLLPSGKRKFILRDESIKIPF